jgi:UDP-N-acetylmuramate dehydrogenase
MKARDEDFRRQLREQVAGKVLFDEPMSLHTSMRAGGRADALVFPAGSDELASIVQFLIRSGVPFFPVGNGTNLIVRDGGYRGVVICLRELRDSALSEAGPQGAKLTALAGTPLSEVVALSVREGLSGLEFCAGIPGSIGGALRMNAGAFGREMKDAVLGLKMINGSGSIKKVERKDLRFSYRDLELPPGALIVSGEFGLERASRETVSGRVREIMGLRASRHPVNYPNSGSIFKNPPGSPAGKLIENCGLKGRRIGDAAVSGLHGNFIINMGNAAAGDIEALIAEIRKAVLAQTGIALETEVKIIGEA